MKLNRRSRSWKTLVIVGICTSAGLWLFADPSNVLSPRAVRSARQPLTAPSGDEFEPIRVLPQHRALTNPALLRASEVGDQVRDDELVLGVASGDHARAYPINMLTGPDREIVNDTLNGIPIAATW